jgi:hypothetical protein
MMDYDIRIQYMPYANGCRLLTFFYPFCILRPAIPGHGCSFPSDDPDIHDQPEAVTCSRVEW